MGVLPEPNALGNCSKTSAHNTDGDSYRHIRLEISRDDGSNVSDRAEKDNPRTRCHSEGRYRRLPCDAGNKRLLLRRRSSASRWVTCLRRIRRQRGDRRGVFGVLKTRLRARVRLAVAPRATKRHGDGDQYRQKPLVHHLRSWRTGHRPRNKTPSQGTVA